MNKRIVAVVVIWILIAVLLALRPIARRYDERKKQEREHAAALRAFRQQSYETVTGLCAALDKGAHRETVADLAKNARGFVKSAPGFSYTRAIEHGKTPWFGLVARALCWPLCWLRSHKVADGCVGLHQNLRGETLIKTR